MFLKMKICIIAFILSHNHITVALSVKNNCNYIYFHNYSILIETFVLYMLDMYSRPSRDVNPFDKIGRFKDKKNNDNHNVLYILTAN